MSAIFTEEKALNVSAFLKQKAGLKTELLYFGCACKVTSSFTDVGSVQLSEMWGSPLHWCCPTCAFNFTLLLSGILESLNWMSNNNCCGNINSLNLLVRVYWAGEKSQFLWLKRACVALPQAISFPPSYITLPCWETEKANCVLTQFSFVLHFRSRLWVHRCRR